MHITKVVLLRMKSAWFDLSENERGKFLAGPKGFEPLTSGSEGLRSCPSAPYPH